MPYALLGLILAAWAWLALRDRPWRQYGRIYAIVAALGCAAECSILGTWYPFQTRVYLFAAPYRDIFLAAMIYCRWHPLSEIHPAPRRKRAPPQGSARFPRMGHTSPPGPYGRGREPKR